MTLWTVIATGPSLKQDDVDYVRGKCKVVAVSNAYTVAPWADCLVSHDRNWWRHYPDAMNFEGPKYCRFELNGTQRFNPFGMPIGCNSGLMGMYVAQSLGASKILLLGFDMKGSHFFGRHGGTLTNTTKQRFSQHLHQFRHFKGCEVINCNPDSALTRFPFGDIRSIL